MGGVEFYFLLPHDADSMDISDPTSASTSDLERRASETEQLAVRKNARAGKKSEPASSPSKNVTVHELTKPAQSYACLIAEAIENSDDKRLTLSGIYKYLIDTYPYFKYTKSGWQVRTRTAPHLAAVELDSAQPVAQQGLQEDSPLHGRAWKGHVLGH